MSASNDGLTLYGKLYSDTIVLRALVSAIPSIGPMTDMAISKIIEKINEKRKREFFEELKNGKIELTKEIIENEDFLHCFFITYNAAIRTRTNEKIRYFGKLLCGALESSTFHDINDYEEILGIVSDLSEREMKILIILDDIETKYPKTEKESELAHADRCWKEFADAVSPDLCDKSELEALMVSLTRSGCYLQIVGSYLGYSGNRGKITPLFRRIRKIATLEYERNSETGIGSNTETVE